MAAVFHHRSPACRNTMRTNIKYMAGQGRNQQLLRSCGDGGRFGNSAYYIAGDGLEFGTTMIPRSSGTVVYIHCHPEYSQE